MDSGKRKKRPAKCPPPHPTVRTTMRVGAPPKEEIAGLQWLRQLAAAQYVTSLQGISIREMAKGGQYSGISLESLQRWSAEDGWVEQRERYYSQVRSEIQAKSQQRLVDVRMREFEQYCKIHESLIQKANSGIVEANSLEGLVSVIVKLGEFMDKFREKIFGDVIPAQIGGTPGDVSQIRPSISVDEARDAAMAIIARRRKELRESQELEKRELEKQSKGVENITTLRVLRGTIDGED